MMTNTKNAFRMAGLALALAGAGWAGLTLANTHTGGTGAAGEEHMMQGMDHGADHGAPAAGVVNFPWAEAYRAANLAMHSAMDIEFSEDADVDFARGMIAHHQGAIDMSRVVLEHGDDPELRNLAEQVIAAQQGEIEFLRTWLAEHGE